MIKFFENLGDLLPKFGEVDMTLFKLVLSYCAIFEKTSIGKNIQKNIANGFDIVLLTGA